MAMKFQLPVLFVSLALIQSTASADSTKVIKVENGVSPVIWRAEIGRRSGAPAIIGDRILVCSDNCLAPKFADSEACVFCFEKATGKLLWKSLHERLGDRNRDLGTGLVETPAVDESSTYYMNNRAQIVCESLVEMRGQQRPTRKWTLDLQRKYNVFFRASLDYFNPYPSPLLRNGVLYCVTGNGSIYGTSSQFANSDFVPAHDAPSFIAIDAKTGNVKWTSNAPSKRILFGQWAGPAYLQTEGATAILFPGGDGYLYALDPTSGELKGSVDLNSKKTKEWTHTVRGDGLLIMHTPTVTKERIFVGLHSGISTSVPRTKQIGAIVCVNPIDLFRKKQAICWRFENDLFEGTIGEMAVVGDILFAVSEWGTVVALDARTGSCHWIVRHLGGSGICPGIAVRQNHIYVPLEHELVVYEAARVPREVIRYRFENEVQSSVAFDKSSMYITTETSLWRISSTAQQATIRNPAD